MSIGSPYMPLIHYGASPKHSPIIEIIFLIQINFHYFIRLWSLIVEKARFQVLL